MKLAGRKLGYFTYVSGTYPTDLLEDHPMTDGYVVNNHSDRKSPKDGVIPFPNGLFMAYKWWLLLVTNHLLTGVILQVSTSRTSQ